MRITCFVLGTLCLLIAAVWAGIGMIDLADRGSASPSAPEVAGLRMTQAAVDTPTIDDFGPASTFAQIFAIAGVAWMVGAAAFGPRPAAPAIAPEPRQWHQPQQYAPQWQQQAQPHQPPHQHPDQQS
jgi:hypothetical protein